MEKIKKFKVISMGRVGPRGCCGRKALNRQIFIVSYLQFVERKHLHATLFSWVRRFNSGKKTGQAAALLKNCSVRTSGSSQGDGSDL